MQEAKAQRVGWATCGRLPGGVLSYGGESWEEGSQTPTQHTPKNPCPLTLCYCEDWASPMHTASQPVRVLLASGP